MRITTLLLAAAAPILISALTLEATAQDFFSNPFEQHKPRKEEKARASGRRSARTRRASPGGRLRPHRTAAPQAAAPAAGPTKSFDQRHFPRRPRRRQLQNHWAFKAGCADFRREAVAEGISPRARSPFALDGMTPEQASSPATASRASSPRASSTSRPSSPRRTASPTVRAQIEQEPRGLRSRREGVRRPSCRHHRLLGPRERLRRRHGQASDHALARRRWPTTAVAAHVPRRPRAISPARHCALWTIPTSSWSSAHGTAWPIGTPGITTRSAKNSKRSSMISCAIRLRHRCIFMDRRPSEARNRQGNE